MWIAKIDNEWSPSDLERWTFKSLEEMISFLKKELAEGDELDGYGFDEFFADLEEEAKDEGRAVRTLKNGSLDVFACSHFTVATKTENDTTAVAKGKKL